MASHNRVILIGNLTRDPELRYLQSGMAVVDLGLAVNDKRKNAAGEWIDETTFVDVTVWGRTAEVAGEYLTKGSPVFIEGRLKLDTWETDGQKRSKLKVVCEKMQLIGAKGQGGQGGPGSRPPMARPAGAGNQYNRAHQSDQADAYSQPAPPDDFGDPPPDMPGGDEIPF
ncbi:MAG: single-stranded DNA-binding protein [Pirellulales bacterium]|nr:single-stranded DNA-binding protein [Pirellulales bacterium]